MGVEGFWLRLRITYAGGVLGRRAKEAEVEMGRPHSEAGRRQMVKSNDELGAREGATAVGQASHKMGRSDCPVRGGQRFSVEGLRPKPR